MNNYEALTDIQPPTTYNFKCLWNIVQGPTGRRWQIARTLRSPRGPVSLAPGSRVPGALCLWGLGTTVFVLSALFDLRAELSIRAASTCFSWRNLLFNCLISLLYETAALPPGDRRWLQWLVVLSCSLRVAARACLPASRELRARASYFIFTNWVVQAVSLPDTVCSPPRLSLTLYVTLCIL